MSWLARIKQWIAYHGRDPWDFADPEKVARWPAEIRSAYERNAA